MSWGTYIKPDEDFIPSKYKDDKSRLLSDIGELESNLEDDKIKLCGVMVNEYYNTNVHTKYQTISYYARLVALEAKDLEYLNKYLQLMENDGFSASKGYLYFSNVDYLDENEVESYKNLQTTYIKSLFVQSCIKFEKYDSVESCNNTMEYLQYTYQSNINEMIEGLCDNAIELAQSEIYSKYNSTSTDSIPDDEENVEQDNNDEE